MILESFDYKEFSGKFIYKLTVSTTTSSLSLSLSLASPLAGKRLTQLQ